MTDIDNKAMLYDKVEIFAGADIQHGPLNQRVYLMHIGQADPHMLAQDLRKLAVREGYTKIFAKLPETKSRPFIRQGYRVEAKVPLLYKGDEDALFLAYYVNDARKKEHDSVAIQKVLHSIKEKQGVAKDNMTVPDNFSLRRCLAADVKRMASLYGDVFQTYPFPINDPDYLLTTMAKDVDYFGVEKERSLIALASAEMNEEEEYVEMTDFATLPVWRSQNLAALLLERMEQAMSTKGIKTAYTIARAISPGINIVFARADYRYGGRLINNTNIAGRIESMNVWYKEL